MIEIKQIKNEKVKKNPKKTHTEKKNSIQTKVREKEKKQSM